MSDPAAPIRSTRARRRRGRRGIGAPAVAVVFLAACAPEARDGHDLLRSAAANAPAEAWRFVDRPDAEQLLRCVAGFEAVTVSVALDDVTRMSIGRADGEDLALWFEDAVYVRGREVGAPDARWVRVDRSNPSSVAEIEAAFGPSLSAWVFAEQPPPAPRAIVESALVFAARVEVLPQLDAASTTVEVTIDERRAADVAGTDTSGYPTLSLVVADGSLIAVAAHSAADPDSFGFRWEYDPVRPVVADEPTDWVDATTIPITPPEHSRRACEIGP